MQRHKRIYKETEENITRFIIIQRRKKFRNLFNKIMFWAHSYKWDKAYQKKYNL